MPLAFIVALAAFAWLPSVQANPRLLWSILAASGALAAWLGALGLASRRRTLTLEVVLRKQHWVQACAHASIFAYWGWYWRPVYDWAPLIVAQLAFAYAFDMLLGWCRRDQYTLGFGPFPVIFSTNLFLWFKPDWYYLQLLMIAVGFAAKELIRWTKDGRRTHIFNPSSFPLALFSVGLLLTGTTEMTFGNEIATTMLQAPYIYLLIFLVALPGQFFFGVTPMTLSAVGTLYGISLVHYAATATYIFPDEFIPIAVFLGMHLLFTDPSTAPRTELGRLLFGVSYALSVLGLFLLLEYLRVPSFYDKLLGVPVLNLLIQRIDAAVRSGWLKWLDVSRITTGLLPYRRNLAYMTIWVVGFVGANATQSNRLDASGTTALHHAASENDLLRVRLLLAAGADAQLRGVQGVTALSLAASHGSASMIDALVRAGASPDVPVGGVTPLMVAASAGSLEAVERLVEAGASVDARDPDGSTAMLLAIINGHFDVAAHLLDKGANAGLADGSGMTPLYAAVDMNSDWPGRQAPRRPGRASAIELVASLLARGADPNARLTSPALMRAYQVDTPEGTSGPRYYAGHPDLGAGSTPFVRAALTADVTAMRLLLKHGADPERATDQGVTALMFLAGFGTRDGAAVREDAEADQSLIEAATLALTPSTINAVSQRGESALQLSRRYRSDRFTKLLTDHGAKPADQMPHPAAPAPALRRRAD